MTAQTATPETSFVQTKHVANKLHVKPTYLRRVLRSMEAYADGVHTNYRWASLDCKEVKAIEAAVVKHAKDKADKAAKAKAALESRKADADKAAKLDKAIAK